ncbi:MAG TPA: hypothetical protein VGD43_17995, partial [Micromonospora sp.]
AGGAPPDGRRTPLPTVRLRRLLRARGNRPNAATSAAALAGLDASTVVDQALADLAAACAAVGRPMPQAHTLLLDERLLRLRLAPADDRPPAPWRATDRGRVWELDRRDVTPASPGPPPYPLLTLVGAAGGALVAVDLAQATGVVALAGDQRGARALALALARRIADRAGPAVSRITVAGFGGPVAPPANHQLWLQVADLPAEPAAAPGAAPDELLAGPATVDRHELLVLGAAPTDPARVAALVRRANRPGHLVVVAGELPGARWRWLVDPDGGVDLEPFGLRVDLPAPTADRS